MKVKLMNLQELESEEILLQIYLILIYGKLVLFIRINNKKIKIINKIFYFLKGKNLNFINNKKIGFLFMFLMNNKKNKSIK